MSVPKLLVFVTLVLFSTIFLFATLKKRAAPRQVTTTITELTEVDLPVEEPSPEVEEEVLPPKEEVVAPEPVVVQAVGEEELPDADRIAELFNKREPKLPIVQTVTYKRHVPWLSGRPAWIVDYASHYKTSRHFIARSLNGRPEYEKQDVVDGDRFNVFKEDKDFEFYLLIDTLTSKMWFYYFDPISNERVLLKTYKVGLGRSDELSESGTLTPLGKYSLGSKVAIFRPKILAYYQGQKTEMVRVFGTRWIPFGEEVGDCAAPAKGYGIHGLPLQENANGDLDENLELLGRYESDGCIRMSTKDVEELFAIIISRSTTVEVVKGFRNGTPPGEEKKL